MKSSSKFNVETVKPGEYKVSEFFGAKNYIQLLVTENIDDDIVMFIDSHDQKRVVLARNIELNKLPEIMQIFTKDHDFTKPLRLFIELHGGRKVKGMGINTSFDPALNAGLYSSESTKSAIECMNNNSNYRYIISLLQAIYQLAKEPFPEEYLKPGYGPEFYSTKERFIIENQNFKININAYSTLERNCIQYKSISVNAKGGSLEEFTEEDKTLFTNSKISITKEEYERLSRSNLNDQNINLVNSATLEQPQIMAPSISNKVDSPLRKQEQILETIKASDPEKFKQLVNENPDFVLEVLNSLITNSKLHEHPESNVQTHNNDHSMVAKYASHRNNTGNLLNPRI